VPEDRLKEFWKIVEYGSDLAKKPLLVGTNGPSKVRISSNASSKVRILGGIFSGGIFSPKSEKKSADPGPPVGSYYAMARELFRHPHSSPTYTYPNLTS